MDCANELVAAETAFELVDALMAIWPVFLLFGASVGLVSFLVAVFLVELVQRLGRRQVR